jgi:hypothetical protein
MIRSSYARAPAASEPPLVVMECCLAADAIFQVDCSAAIDAPPKQPELNCWALAGTDEPHAQWYRGDEGDWRSAHGQDGAGRVRPSADLRLLTPASRYYSRFRLRLYSIMNSASASSERMPLLYFRKLDLELPPGD